MVSDDEKENRVYAVASHLIPLPGPIDRLDELFREHHDLVFRSAYRVTGTAVDAEDVLQTVFLRLANRHDVADLAPSPSAYLRRAAINAALDIVRARSRRRDVSLEDVTLTGSASPESLHQSREIQDQVRRAER